jgi:hypothetical protein
MLTAFRRDGRALLSAPIHPVLTAAFFVLFLFAENAEQQVTLDPLWQPLLVCLAGAAVVLLVLAAALRDWQRGALLATWLLALFFAFGHVYNLVGAVFETRKLMAVPWVVLAIAGAAAIVLARRIRGGEWVRPANQFLNVAVLLLVAFNGFRVASYAQAAATAAATVAPPEHVEVSPPATLPDVYYIILDRYAGPATLRNVYGFDNEPFLQELEKRGFSVARDAWANYFKTALSVYSSLSMEPITKARLGETDPPYNFTRIFAALRGHLTVPSTFKAMGYHYIHLGNYWEPTAHNVDADVTLRYQAESEFGAALFATSFLSAVAPPPAGAGGDEGETSSSHELAANTTLYTFDQLAAAADRPGPNYVFAHILLPHPPYVFDANGNQISDEQRRGKNEKQKYVDQVQFANTKVLAAIDRLLADPTDPVIVLQADEGPWPRRFSVREGNFQWLRATDGEIAQKFGILNAIHLPDGIDPGQYGFTDHTSPVNEFRVVFDAVFGAHLPMLPDMTYLSPNYRRMYDFVEYPPRP